MQPVGGVGPDRAVGLALMWSNVLTTSGRSACFVRLLYHVCFTPPHCHRYMLINKTPLSSGSRMGCLHEGGPPLFAGRAIDKTWALRHLLDDGLPLEGPGLPAEHTAGFASTRGNKRNMQTIRGGLSLGTRRTKLRNLCCSSSVGGGMVCGMTTASSTAQLPSVAIVAGQGGAHARRRAAQAQWAPMPTSPHAEAETDTMRPDSHM